MQITWHSTHYTPFKCKKTRHSCNTLKNRGPFNNNFHNLYNNQSASYVFLKTTYFNEQNFT